LIETSSLKPIEVKYLEFLLQVGDDIMQLSFAESYNRLVLLQPVKLSGQRIYLEPLSETHLADLSQVGLDAEIWRFMLYGKMQTDSDLHRWILEMLERQKKGKDLPFTVIQRSNGKAIGCTRYMNVEAMHRSLEIGGTWYGRFYQGSGVNVEAKYLLLKYAFEYLGCIRVQLKTDARNLQSQRAIERLGAVKEGVLRNHMILPDGTIRDSIYYSILDEEWPQVKQKLEQRLEKLQVDPG
jgi:RimJ/RimL family protein N-acetyltransferase